MRAFTRAMIKGSLTIVALGILIMLIGIFSGADHEFNWNQNLMPNKDLQKIDETYKNVKSLNIDLQYGNLKIEEGDSFRIKSDGIIKDGFVSEVKDGVWKISDKNVARKFHWNVKVLPLNVAYTDKFSSEIIIYVPKGFEGENLNLKVGAGKVSAESLNSSGETNIAVGAGEIDIDNMNLENATINCGAGSVTANGTLTGDSMVKCDVGKVNLNLNGNEEDYNYNVNCNLGSVDLNGKAFGFHTEKSINNANATNDLDLECNVGKVNLMMQ